MINDRNIEVNHQDVILAMRKMGKNKAPSVDGTLDTIFQEEEWRPIEIDGEEDRGGMNLKRNNYIRYNLA